MALALDHARAAGRRGEVPVGAVIVRDGELLGEGGNEPIGANDPTAHAEVVALRDAARRAGNYRLPGAVLYVTLEPCPMCAGAIVHARIAEVVYAAPDPRQGAAGSVFNLLDCAELNHRARVRGGVLGEQAGELLREFFRDRRG